MKTVKRRDDFVPPKGGIDEILPRRASHEKKRLPIPISPVIHSALRAIYAGGHKSRWLSDTYGRPFYRYETHAGTIRFCFAPPDFGNRFHPTIAMHYTPRLGFVYSGGLRNVVKSLSVETADVFLVLMSRIAELKDPMKGIARISLEEIAQLRGVRLRHGSTQNLYEDFKQEVLRLADIHLTMSWKDYKTGGEINFGRERPDSLWRIAQTRQKARLPHQKKQLMRKKMPIQKTPQFTVPKTAKEIMADQSLIRRFRADFFLRQDELARALGVTRQTLSNYERGLHPLPEDKAVRVLNIWQRKAL